MEMVVHHLLTSYLKGYLMSALLKDYLVQMKLRSGCLVKNILGKQKSLIMELIQIDLPLTKKKGHLSEISIISVMKIL